MSATTKLPTPSGSVGTWGAELNDFLTQSMVGTTTGDVTNGLLKADHAAITTGGKVGIGTSTPTTLAQVKDGDLTVIGTGKIGIGNSAPTVAIEIGVQGSVTATDRIKINGRYNFEEVSIGQTGNGGVSLEMYNHSIATDSSSFVISKNVDLDAEVVFKVAPPAMTKSSLVFKDALKIKDDGRVKIPNLEISPKITGIGEKLIRIETCNGDGGANSAQVYVNNAFGPKAICIAAFDENKNSVPVTQILANSQLCAFLALIPE